MFPARAVGLVGIGGMAGASRQLIRRSIRPRLAVDGSYMIPF